MTAGFLVSLTAALLSLSLSPSPVWAATLTQDFTVAWVTANPDGAFQRPTIGINGKWPPPLIRATVGDRLILNVHNNLGNASTSVHFHGLFQNGTNYMDGAVGVTQCAIPPGSSLTYDIKFEQPGTYWYHAHNDGQYPEGFRAPVVVHDPQGPHEGKYDDELIISLSDWYHRPVQSLLQEFISVENPTGAEPVPQAALLNDTQDLQVRVDAGKTYLVRLVNVGAFAAHYFWVEGHEMRVVEVDGVWTQEAAPAQRLYIAPAQRYSVLLTTRERGDENFAMVSAMDEELFDVIPEGQNSNVTGWLVYDDAKPLPRPKTVDRLDAFDDFDLVPVDGLGLLGEPDYSITLDAKMGNLGDGANYAFFNDMTYVAPKVPSLYSALTVGPDHAANPRVYGTNTIPHVLSHNAVIQIVLNNGDDGDHPFHLHGHNFQVIHRSPPDAGVFIEDEGISFPPVPMRRDTVVVQGNGNMVLRFRADNPGVWLFHCHIEWHMEQGLVATFVEAPAELRRKLKDGGIPEDHLAACRAAGVPAEGNAAGNTRDVLDLSGENRAVPPLPEGFTAKGYIAMAGSCVSALLGLASIAWYGTMDMEKKGAGGESPVAED
ncbi:iron transport multicopper oxidase FET3 [Sodiomyces alkalinus F11]|uniref:Iron transport multicopper oxidase FET3 n=1 Tax=Sodiomyces alkalinus (strain CBS 110278 / VKM F-3762 / F11) TaxID=1314773 RepID=A0A3N2PTJ0_SODAK|nr:iron transport multicopper oxidase FET3 [Sodiomyces alkalinus F11]ROT37827.1 iron transport multicopper oxidase FET3 [Sodiomyces alkalinus F11]